MLEAPTMYRDGDPAEETFDRLRVLIYSSDFAPSGILTRETKLRDLGDSLGMVALSFDIEAEFGVRMGDDDLESFETVADVIRFLERAQ